jgi:hypothetical protein
MSQESRQTSSADDGDRLQALTERLAQVEAKTKYIRVREPFSLAAVPPYFWALLLLLAVNEIYALLQTLYQRQ